MTEDDDEQEIKIIEAKRLYCFKIFFGFKNLVSLFWQKKRRI